ncbi:excision repaiross-complementing rodent repair deficiency, complementation group 8 [Helicostylum pulchrum]|nr:excision repaiross-complementing rodent repair deficiency, complementation group 8 [Helicostylum pulchrum]
MYSVIKQRQYGLINPLKLEREEITRRAYNLQLSQSKEIALSHRGGVNTLKVETTEQKYLLSGGGDGKVHIFDLDSEHVRKEAIASISRADRHQYAVTSVTWYPFDTGMFVTSSYDKTIKVWDTNTMSIAYQYDFECGINQQSMSPIASHSLVASAASEPRIRLCDLNSGAFTHSLMGHSGSVLSCIWSPNQDYILYSGGNDHTIRVWDIRRASSCLMSLDKDNAPDPLADTNTAHGKGVNGLSLTNDGRYLVSLGLDEKIRLWDTETGHNTLVNYGSNWRNQFQLSIEPTISGPDVWPPLLYVPSDDRKILIYRLLDGVLVRKLKGHYGRVSCIEKREAYQEFYSGSSASEILSWEPPMQDDGDDDWIKAAEEVDAWSESEDSLPA